MKVLGSLEYFEGFRDAPICVGRDDDCNGGNEDDDDKSEDTSGVVAST